MLMLEGVQVTDFNLKGTDPDAIGEPIVFADEEVEAKRAEQSSPDAAEDTVKAALLTAKCLKQASKRVIYRLRSRRWSTIGR